MVFNDGNQSAVLRVEDTSRYSDVSNEHNTETYRFRCISKVYFSYLVPFSTKPQSIFFIESFCKDIFPFVLFFSDMASRGTRHRAGPFRVTWFVLQWRLLYHALHVQSQHEGKSYYLFLAGKHIRILISAYITCYFRKLYVGGGCY